MMDINEDLAYVAWQDAEFEKFEREYHEEREAEAYEEWRADRIADGDDCDLSYEGWIAWTEADDPRDEW